MFEAFQSNVSLQCIGLLITPIFEFIEAMTSALKQRSFESPIISSPIKSSKQMFNSFSKLFSRRKTS